MLAALLRCLAPQVRTSVDWSVRFLLNTPVLCHYPSTYPLQYRNGGTTENALRTLWEEGGVPRLYRGLSFALVQGPLSRWIFGQVHCRPRLTPFLQCGNLNPPSTRTRSSRLKAFRVERVALSVPATHPEILQRSQTQRCRPSIWVCERAALIITHAAYRKTINSENYSKNILLIVACHTLRTPALFRRLPELYRRPPPPVPSRATQGLETPPPMSVCSLCWNLLSLRDRCHFR